MILKSKTVLFNLFMGSLEAANAALAVLEPILTPEQFIVVTTVLGAVHAAGGVFLRMITVKPVGEL